MPKKFFKSLRGAESYGLNMGNRWSSPRMKSRESPQGFSKPWMTKYTPGKGYWVKITQGKNEGKSYPVKRTK
tara:strand:- start:1294 stop:1509 length:216 start_codon:yes stop_codon:yes gene_type:complete